ncbi:MAG: tRNA guanosine(34) transglycosylase Tgt [Ignavibacteriaceae bacterium]|nr:tRNA guanosine(34) transglycosylase Tgt [Ignavibacteriaceae bacterium]NUM69504.1 tRNA guanosine(34) transglycosylase Tgt [Ignavibacteriaceae bacterium]
MKFTLQAKDQSSKARAGFFETAHGIVETPVFMPVGTQGTVKAVSQLHLKNVIDTKIILNNTYHLYLRPGTDLLEKAGGVHNFISWDRAILTDSGGFQIFSLSDFRKLKPDGVEFKSHLDGSKHFFTPARIVDIQRSIGSDIMMVLDECTPYPCDFDYAAKSIKLTTKWATLCKEAFMSSKGKYGYDQYMFGIVQGSTFKELRERSAKELVPLDFDGYAIGGLAVGEPAEIMYDMVGFTTDFMPEEKPRYLMGVGRPENLLESVERGVDMFDCVMPTRNARNAYIFTNKGCFIISNSQYKEDFTPLDPDCGCFTCRNFTKAYIRHLFSARELLAYELASVHNIYFFVNLLKEARKQILNGTFSEWKKETVKIVSFHHKLKNGG